VAKSFSLPNRVPFGVTSGTFSIGVDTSVSTDSQAGSQNLDDPTSQAGSQPSTSGINDDPSNKLNPGDVSNTETSSSGSTSKSAKTLATLSTSRTGQFYLYSFDGKLLRQYDVYGVLLKDFIYMGNRLVAECDRVGNRYLYYTQDQISSTRVVTDGSGTVVYSEAYNPYGGVQKT